MRVVATVKKLRRSLFLSRPSAVAPPELLSCRQVADWETLWQGGSATTLAQETVVEHRRLCVSLWDFLAHAQQIAFAFKQSAGG